MLLYSKCMQHRMLEMHVPLIIQDNQESPRETCGEQSECKDRTYFDFAVC